MKPTTAALVVTACVAGCGGGGGPDVPEAVTDTTQPAVTFPVVTSSCTDQFEVSFKDFRLQNNQWGKADAAGQPFEQCVTLTESSAGDFLVEWTWDWPFGTGKVKAYPEVYYGSKFGVESAPGLRLPEQVSNLSDYRVSFSYEPGGDALLGEMNVALESWFHPSESIALDNRVAELMVWVERTPNFFPPGYVADVDIGGAIYEFYYAPNGPDVGLEWQYFAFVAKTPMRSGTLSWNRFVEYLVAEQLLDPSVYMADIEFGTEIIAGQGSMSLQEISVDVN